MLPELCSTTVSALVLVMVGCVSPPDESVEVACGVAATGVIPLWPPTVGTQPLVGCPRVVLERRGLGAPPSRSPRDAGRGLGLGLGMILVLSGEVIDRVSGAGVVSLEAEVEEW